ncbi:hypothetical protein D3C78_1892750 [compost metagenome]
MIRMLDAATDRARLIVLQLPAQLFDAGTARQALAFQQLQRDLQSLLGQRQLGPGLHAFAGQALAFVVRGV